MDKTKAIAKIIALFLVLLIIGCNGTTAPISQDNVRKAQYAGTWYPGDFNSLSDAIDGYLTNGKKAEVNKVKAIIVPHAGYSYSGIVAGSGYNQIDSSYDKVIIIGTNHDSNIVIDGIGIPNYTHYETPLGTVKVSPIAKELLKDGEFKVLKEDNMHVIEIQLPFLQKKLGNFEIIPLITGGLDYSQIKDAADSLMPYIDNKTLIVVSSDLSHYHPYDEAVSMDNKCVNSISSLNIEEAANCEACSIYASMILMEIAKEKGWKAKVIDQRNSGDTTGDKTSVVGYSAIAFYQDEDSCGFEEFVQSENDKKELLRMSRDKLDSLYEGKSFDIKNYKISETMKKEEGCFVTLNIDGNLRGCIGYIMPQKELYKCVIDNTMNAALFDSRFNPVKKEEVSKIKIEISTLSVPQKLAFSSPDDLKNKLRPLKDGVVLKNGLSESTYLPQVWEQIPDKEMFLKSLCEKGGMNSECWKDKNTEVSVYQASVFGEE